MEVNFGHLEVLHSKFHDPTISNLGDQSGQTNKHTHKETNRQRDLLCRCNIRLAVIQLSTNVKTSSIFQLYSSYECKALEYIIFFLINILEQQTQSILH